MNQSSAIVVGAGIVGLSAARALSLQGYRVTVIERSEQAVGASVRNFGMVWPIGQPEGYLYDRAVRSRECWKEMADSIGLWYAESGSLHVAHQSDEWEVIQELYAAFSKEGRPVSLLSPDDIYRRFQGVNPLHLQGGLYSSAELIVDPREAIARIPAYLSEYLDVQFMWGKAVTAVETGVVHLGDEKIQTDLICICSGPDFEILYPRQLAELPLTKCKLQMMRFLPDNSEWRMGTSVCGGLSLIHYRSFTVAEGLSQLKKRYETEMAEYLKWGIHVMVAQNDKGELTVGDSHEYGHTHDPFDKAAINHLIIDYLKSFMLCQDWRMIQSWNGTYSKMTNGATDVILQPDPGVFILNGLGGAGMTLSFGLAEEFAAKL